MMNVQIHSNLKPNKKKKQNGKKKMKPPSSFQTNLSQQGLKKIPVVCSFSIA
jgi:hypothetical protein